MPPQVTPNPSIPDDLLLSCLARVSRLYYPTLSLVSKGFRSLLASPELYQTRSLLGRTETCLYMCLFFRSDPTPRWYTLRPNPNGTLPNLLVPILVPNSHNARRLVALGSNIYSIGGFNYTTPSSHMSILDCRSHMWHEGPSMRVKRNFPVISVLDGKIYVAGGCTDDDLANWMEVFDPKTKTWESVLCPLEKRYRSRVITTSAVIEGTIYLLCGKELIAYKPMEDRWEVVSEDYLGQYGKRGLVTCCLIDNVLYSTSYLHGIRWYDSTKRKWRVLNGLPNFESYGGSSLADYGGKLAFFCDRCGGDGNRKIYCAVIALERRNSNKIWGKVEWSDTLLTVPIFSGFVPLTPTV